jgi:CDP-glycerol glycerophosphotransferase
MRERWREWFAFRDFAATGYPRNDVLLREAVGEELINVDIHALNDLKAAREKSRKTILYMPTFRDNIGALWLERTDINDFAAWCENKGYTFYVKLHPAEAAGFESVKQNLPSVRFIKPDSDPYPLLRQADLLITDYSSLALDYLLLDRPMIFYWPDHEGYRKQCRNLLPGFEHYIAGERAMTNEALRNAVENAFAGGSGPWVDKRRALMRELFDQRDDGAADRVARLILEQLEMPEELPSGWGI